MTTHSGVLPHGAAAGFVVGEPQNDDCNVLHGNGVEHYQLKQWDADVHAVGHFDPYITHELHAREDARSLISDRENIDPRGTWFKQIESEDGRIVFNGSILVSKGRTQPNNPYMNIFTTRGVMSGHNDIWNEVVSSFLGDLIRVSMAE